MKTLELKGGKEVPVRKTAGKGKLSWRDLLHGAIWAALMPVLVIVQQYVTAWFQHLPVTIDYRALLQAAIGGAALYISKKLATPAQVIIKLKELQKK